MTKKGPSSKVTPKEREARQAAALRANLLKRKEQQRAREGGFEAKKEVSGAESPPENTLSRE